jgi:hypothetical protein
VPFAEVVEARTIVSGTLEKRLKLLFVLRRVANKFRYRTAALLRCDFDNFERISANVFRKKEPTRFALPASAKIQDDCFGDTSW